MTRTPQRGFTLIELAIVVAIIGISIAGAMAGISALRENNRMKQTNIALRDVEHALTLFVIRNGRLPYAASVGSADGEEDGITTYGEVPYAALGLSLGEIVDGWNNRLRYAVDNNLAAAGSLQCDAPGLAQIGTLGILDATSNTADQNTFTKVAYVTISPGGNAAPDAPNDDLGPPDDDGGTYNLFRDEGIAAGFDDIVQGRAGGQILRDGGCRLVSELEGSGGGGGGDGGGDDGGLTPGAEEIGTAVSIADLGAGNVTTGKDPVAYTDDGETGVSTSDGGQVHVAHKGQSPTGEGVGTNNSGLGQALLFEFTCPRSAYSVKFLDFALSDRATIVGYAADVEVGRHVACASDGADCDAHNSETIATGLFAGRSLGGFTGRFGANFDALEFIPTDGNFWIHELRTQKTDACPADDGGGGGDDGGGDDGGGGATGQCNGTNPSRQASCSVLNEAACKADKKCEWTN